MGSRQGRRQTRRQTHGRGKRPAGRDRGARPRLGARAGQGCALGALGLFLAQFDSIFFLSQIFWTLFVNPVHEHCSSQNFLKIFFY